MKTPLITLTTDFGLADSYVAQMKAVLLSELPTAQLVDVSHDVPPQDIQAAARLLRDAVPYFPENTIHLAVVDPGVGTSRRGIVLEALVCEDKHAFFVGPDNGLFSIVVERESRLHAWEIVFPGETKGISTTFHGRDIFAPTACMLMKSEREKGPISITQVEVSSLIELQEELARYDRNSKCYHSAIVSFDHFGNARTNLHVSEVEEQKIHVAELQTQLGHRSAPLVRTFQEIPERSLGLLVNSAGYYELAAKEQSAKDIFGLQIGLEVKLVF